MDTDTDAAFVGEASIGGREPSTKAGSQGEENALLAKGGVDAHLGQDAQDPLLLESSGGPNDDRGPGHHEWSASTDFDDKPWYKRPSIYFMLCPFLVMTLAFGGIITPRLNLLLNLICREYIAERKAVDPTFSMLPVVFDMENPQCRIPEVQVRVAQFTLYGNLIAGLLSAITSPRLGALSDRYGRTRLLSLTSLGTIFGEVIMIVAANYPDQFAVNWILLGFAFEGLCGSFVCAMAISNAYASDCTPPAGRNTAFGYFHGAMFTGIALGPILAGFIVKATGSALSIFYISLGVHICFVIFVFLAVPESLAKSRQYAARAKHREEKELLGPSSDWIDRLRAINLFEPLKILWPRGEGTSSAIRRNLVVLAAVDTILFGVAMGSMTVVIIYTNFQFGWGSFESGMFLSIVNTCRVSALVIVLPLVTRYVRGKAGSYQQKSSGSDMFDLTVIRVAVFFDTIGYLGYALARTGPLMILSGCIASIGGIGSPTLQAALTKHVPADRTGQLLGASGLLHALARVVAPTIFNAIYLATVGKFTQTVFVCLTCTFAAAFVLSWFVRPHVYLQDYTEPPPPVYTDNDPAETEDIIR